MPAVGDQHRGGPATIGMPGGPTTGTTNPFDEPQRHMSEYTAMEIATLQARLDKKLGPEYISSRPGAGGQRVHYLSADKCINLANEVFGFNGWSSSIQKIDIDFIEENQNTGKISLGLSVIVRITLRDGTFHEDIGYGHIENCKGKAAAFEKSKKEGTTDALKRTLRTFGNVLGNCVYDKDYLAKVIKIKPAPTKWEVEDLHRHRDNVPRKEPSPPPSRIDVDLPPARPIEPLMSGITSNAITATAAFEADGEFGSDLFDEADFVVSASGNPDEIAIEPDIQRQQPPAPMDRQVPPRGAPIGRYDQSAVTPSKPERFNAGNPAGRQPIPTNTRQPPSVIPVQKRPPPLVQSHNIPNGRPGAPPQAPYAQQAFKKEPGLNQDIIQPPAAQPVGFFSARAADTLRENPNAATIPGSQFDPHAESPSIRKTVGVDHSKSVPITKPMLSAGSPAPNNSRDFVNPSADPQRRVGAPGGALAAASPLSRGPSVSSYRPLTRPNLPNTTATNRGISAPPQNMNGKRPPMNDVTNATNTTPTAPIMSPHDPKRLRVSDVAPGQQPQATSAVDPQVKS